MTKKTAAICASLIGLMLLHAGPVAAQSYTISPPPFQVVLDDSGNIVVGGCVWTYVAGTTTPIATYSNNSGTENRNPIQADYAGRFTAYLLAGTNYKFVYETACTSPAHGSVLRTADNIAGVPAAAATVDITGLAGETISAGLCAYLSDGSGSKNSGQWYKCDSANGYSSSTALLAGIAPSAITSGATGTIRLFGSVSGLSSLTLSARYYAGTGGVLTSTLPTNARFLGVADSTTSLILDKLPIPNADNAIEDFRLTLTQGVPNTPTDVTAATTLYASPYRGNRIALFDSAGTATVYTSAEFSIPVPATTSQMYDIFAYANAGVPTLELLAWTNDTTRATAIVLTTTGTYTKTGDLTRRYLGSFRTTTVSGQTEDSATKRYVWNYYNRDRRVLLRQEATANWPYSTATIRQANGSTSNQVDVIVGVQEAEIDLSLTVLTSNSTGGIVTIVGIGEDSIIAFSSSALGVGYVNNATANLVYPSGPIRVAKKVAIGRHFYAWLEWSGATATSTFYSTDPAGVSATKGGLVGWIEG